MQIAIVQDSIVSWGGAERVLQQFLLMFPEADLYTTVFFPPDAGNDLLNGKIPRTTFVQKLPFARRLYKSAYFPLMPIAIEQLDLSQYQLVISSSFSVAKGVLTGPDQVHVSYVHSPARYAWDLQASYLQSVGRGLRSLLTRWLLHKFRIWDVSRSAGVDLFIANSHFVARRVRKSYGRKSVVIYPPVDVAKFAFSPQKEDFYLVASRLVSYKRIDLVVDAFAKMPDKKLVVVGHGPEFGDLRKRASPNVSLVGFQSDHALADLMRRARAFIFPGEDDFGIAPVEAQACGTPVIAFGKGGALESVIGCGGGRTGIFFSEQSEKSIRATIAEFETLTISPEACRANALRFSNEEFREAFGREVASALEGAAADREY